MTALVFWLAVPTAEASFTPVTVNIDAKTHTALTPVTVSLPAGTFVLTVVQGQFKAWNAWNGSTVDCNAQGSGCSRGWLTEYRYASPSLGSRSAEFNGRFSTEALAFAAVSAGTTITLPTAETVRFWVNDSVYRDNLGGVSLRIEAIALLDTTAPVITSTVGGTLGGNGWYVSDVSVAWTVTDAESAVTNTSGCEARSVTSDTVGVTFTCQATSSGGTGDKSVTIKRDATAPVIAAAPTPVANANGWYDADVTVTFTCADAVSGVDTCAAPVKLQAEAASQSASGSAADKAGNSASTSVGGISIDKTPPAVSYAGNAGTYSVDQTVSITCSATDALSGVESTTCQNVAGPAYRFTLGTNTFSASATDRAGNTGTGSTSFTVNDTATSLCALTRQFVTGPGANGISNALCSKLSAAEAAAARGNTTAKANAIDAYVNEVTAQTGKSLTADQAGILGQLARAL